MKNVSLFMALLLVLAGVIFSGCVQQTTTSQPSVTTVTTENNTVPTQQNITPAQNQTPIVTSPAQNVTNTTNATQQAVIPSNSASYSAADCSIITVDDIRSICNDSTLVVAPTNATGSDLCAIQFGTTSNTPGHGAVVHGDWVKIVVSQGTEAQVIVGVNACQGFGKAVGTTGCIAQMGDSGAFGNVAKGTYLVSFSQISTTNPAKWVCTKDQMTTLINLVQSR